MFEEWNKTELDSFLIEITANILKFRDSDGRHLLPKIRDSAGQKGTGKWTAISALEYGVPVTLIGNVRSPPKPLVSFALAVLLGSWCRPAPKDRPREPVCALSGVQCFPLLRRAPALEPLLLPTCSRSYGR